MSVYLVARRQSLVIEARACITSQMACRLMYAIFVLLDANGNAEPLRQLSRGREDENTLRFIQTKGVKIKMGNFEFFADVLPTVSFRWINSEKGPSTIEF
jgi:hypothetical protein